MSGKILPMLEGWGPVEDELWPELSIYEVSSLGRVRVIATGDQIEPTKESLVKEDPEVRLKIPSSNTYQPRRIADLVAEAFGQLQVPVAVQAVLHGLDGLQVLREELLETMAAVDAAIGVVALTQHAENSAVPSSPRTMLDYALVEASSLGSVLRSYLDVDPISTMTRSEKLSRLFRLRAAYGPVIDEASQLPLADISLIAEAFPVQ